LTLPTQWGLILTAFIALFIKVVGGYLWGIICFALHQRIASPRPEDDIYHQFQVVLRNTENEASFLWSLYKIALAHRGARGQIYKRSVWLILLAFVHAVGFSIAGGLSSRFVVANNEVQVLPGKCGWYMDSPFTNITNDAAFEQANAQIVSARNGYRSSAIYSSACYARREGKDTNCASYVTDLLPYDTKTNLSCPFDQKICNASAIVMDTGFLQSDKHFGINTLAKDAMSLRKQLTCAPLNGENYTPGWVQTNESTVYPAGTWVKGYKFGPNPDDDPFKEYTTVVAQSTLKWGDLRYNLASSSYFQNYTGDKAALFVPIDELKTDDSDLSLIYLTNRVQFRHPMSDPFLRADNCTDVKNDILDEVRLCSATSTLSFMGCEERYQICTADNKLCTPFTGVYAIQEPLKDLDPTQNAIYKVLWRMLWTSQLNLQIGLVGRDNLVANQYLWDNNFRFGISSDLPPDHWHHEVANWMNTSLAVLQRSATTFVRPAEFIAGSGNSSLQYIEEPYEKEMQMLCHKVKMRSAEFTSFSVLGLFLTLSIGILIMLANGAIPVLVASWQRRTGQGGYKRLEWIESKAFQLQRMAAEGRGIGPWEGKDADVPVLVDRGYRFNLTSHSLKGGDGGLRGREGYRGIAMGEEGEGPAYEMVGFDDKGRRM
jgi:hypothetical protein